MEKLKNIPSLRFPEFEENWRINTLGELIKIKSGNSPSTFTLLENGIYPFIKVEELNNCSKYQSLSRFYSNNKKYLIDEFSVIFPKRGAAILNNKVRINVCPILMDSNMMAITPLKGKINHEFLYYKIIKEELYKIADTSTIPQINNKHIEPYKIIYPSLPEQTKISSFLTAVDDKLQALKQKKTLLEKHKKGLMQKIFSQELRFKDDNGNGYPDWGVTKLGEILIEKNEKTSSSGQHRILSSTAKGLFNQDEYFTRDIASKDNTGYKILRKYQLVFSPQNLWLGNINVNMNFEIGIVSPSYKIFSFDEKFTIAEYCQYFLLTPKMMFEYEQSSTQGASVVRRNLDMDKFLSIEFLLPSIDEQTKIATFLSAIDDKINHCQVQIEKMEVWKKGLLQQMFV
jgi:type I restriction enzyme S subunit